MAERADTPATSTTVVDKENESEAGERFILRLKLRKPESKKKVQWESGTVDNENMNKKKSKCCCIYHKPHEFDVSSSESDDECENCFGHVEVRKKRVKSEDDDKPLDVPEKERQNENSKEPQDSKPKGEDSSEQ